MALMQFPFLVLLLVTMKSFVVLEINTVRSLYCSTSSLAHAYTVVVDSVHWEVTPFGKDYSICDLQHNCILPMYEVVF
jgi:hypothetical protein